MAEKETYIGKEADTQKSLKDSVKAKLQKIDVTTSVESTEGNIQNFFSDLDNYEDADKISLLNDVLKDGEIMIGNGSKKLKEIADDFSEHVEQDGASWKIKEKTDLPEDKQYLEQFLNQKDSAMAYLIQKTANFINIEASRGYGKSAAAVEEVTPDKIFGNQTYRALKGLKSWIENDSAITVESLAEKEISETELKEMSFISKTFLEALRDSEKDENKNLFAKYWKEENGVFKAKDEFKFKHDWSNNYVIDFWETSSEIIVADTSKIEEYTVDDILKMETIDKEFLTSLRADNSEVFNTYWKEEEWNFSVKDGYVYKAEEGNYAIKVCENDSNLEEMQNKNVEAIPKAAFDVLHKKVSSLYVNSADVSSVAKLESPFVRIIFKKHYPKSLDINLGNYLKNERFDDDLLKMDITTQINKLEEEKQQLAEERTQRRLLDQNHQNMRYEIPKETYSLSDLHKWKEENEYYKLFYSTFPENKVRFHSAGNYMSIKGDELVFDLDQKDRDQDYVEGLKIPLKDISLEDGKLDKEKFKKALANKIDEIIEENFTA